MKTVWRTYTYIILASSLANTLIIIIPQCKFYKDPAANQLKYTKGLTCFCCLLLCEDLKIWINHEMMSKQKNNV